MEFHVPKKRGRKPKIRKEDDFAGIYDSDGSNNPDLYFDDDEENDSESAKNPNKIRTAKMRVLDIEEA